MGGGGGREGWLVGGSRWGNLGWGVGGTGSPYLPLPSLQPYHHHKPNLTFAASWFGHASHVDWAEPDPPNFVHDCFCHIIALHFGPQDSL